MERPTTSDMISMLLNYTMTLPTPNKPTFYTGVVESKSTSDESKTKDCSVNNMTVTVMEAPWELLQQGDALKFEDPSLADIICVSISTTRFQSTPWTNWLPPPSSIQMEQHNTSNFF
ncbi:hypothetical protein L6452_32015 [Arctium lappa]|uniref:Uncharacterized protein n=1 Tax=Arctium lappa TaxID=4217 RepID=A0ACB8Z2J4_ARCLA|nr:hypothetical protein L6452_32015 [Arctium lappa]